MGVAQSTLNDFLKRKEEVFRNEVQTAPPTPTVTGAGANRDSDIRAIREAAAARFRAKHERAELKEDQHIRFPHGPVLLVFMGDQHIGNAGTDVERMFREQELINETPGAYVWQMGDTVDNFIVGKLMAENMKPSLPVWEQWVLAQYYLESFGDKLVAYCGGNHEAWALMLSGIDYRRDICPEGVLYDGDEIRATVRVGEHEYRIWTRHKWRGASSYNPTHQLERAARFDSPNFDLYVGAHLHTGAVYREFTLDGARKAAIQTGAYKIHDDYARSSGFPRNDASSACAVLLSDTGSFFGCADLRAMSDYMKAMYG